MVVARKELKSKRKVKDVKASSVNGGGAACSSSKPVVIITDLKKIEELIKKFESIILDPGKGTIRKQFEKKIENYGNGGKTIEEFYTFFTKYPYNYNKDNNESFTYDNLSMRPDDDILRHISYIKNQQLFGSVKDTLGNILSDTSPTRPKTRKIPTTRTSATSPTRPKSSTSPTRPTSSTSPTRPKSSTSPTRPKSSTSPTITMRV